MLKKLCILYIVCKKDLDDRPMHGVESSFVRLNLNLVFFVSVSATIICNMLRIKALDEA
jgi:hypothetical protein